MGHDGCVTSGHGTDLERAHHAKNVILARFQQTAWWRGAGVAPVPGGWAVRVNVAEPCDEVPGEVDGVPIEVRVVGDVTAQRQTE